MQTYKFDSTISESGTILLPLTMPDLYGREVEVFVIPKEEKAKKIKKASAKRFVNRWAGFLNNMNVDPEIAK